MAKLCSSSGRPLLLAVLLLLASIQAGPVMAALKQAVDVLEKGGDELDNRAWELCKKLKLGLKDSCNGGKWVIKADKYGHKAQGWMDKHSGTPYFVVDTIAITTGLRLKVVSADITSTPVAKTGFCSKAVVGAVVGAVAAGGTGTQLIRLLGSRPGSDEAVVLGGGPLRGTLQYCTAVVDGSAGAVLGLGRGGDLSRSFPTFSYYVYVTSGGNTVAVVWFPQPQVPAAGTGASITLAPGRYPNDGRYYVRMTGIRVVGLGPADQELVQQTRTGLILPPPLYLYLSTTQPNTYIESNLYGSLWAAVIRQMNKLNPGATPTSSPLNKLCYAGAGLRLPRIAIILTSYNGMESMELGGAAWDIGPSRFCLGILPATTEEPVLGSMIQSGKTMTIDLMAAGGQGTLTF